MAQQAASQAIVTDEIGIWKICEDAQGEFYFNSQTQETFDQPPTALLQLVQQRNAQQAATPQQVALPQQAAVPQQAAMPPQVALPQQAAMPQQAPVAANQCTVKASFGAWKICQDTEGEFYYNSQTQQSFNDAPPELLQLVQAQKQQAPPPCSGGAAAGPGQATVKASIGIWKVCQDAEGEYFWNSQTQQAFDRPPPELMQILQTQSKAAVSSAPPAPPIASPASFQPTPGPQAGGQAKVKLQVGPWAVCQDAQGEFYFNVQTKQSFDQPPPELRQMLQQQQQQQQPQQPQQQRPLQQMNGYASYGAGMPQKHWQKQQAFSANY